MVSGCFGIQAPTVVPIRLGRLNFVAPTPPLSGTHVHLKAGSGSRLEWVLSGVWNERSRLIARGWRKVRDPPGKGAGERGSWYPLALSLNLTKLVGVDSARVVDGHVLGGTAGCLPAMLCNERDGGGRGGLFHPPPRSAHTHTQNTHTYTRAHSSISPMDLISMLQRPSGPINQYLCCHGRLWARDTPIRQLAFWNLPHPCVPAQASAAIGPPERGKRASCLRPASSRSRADALQRTCCCDPTETTARAWSDFVEGVMTMVVVVVAL